MRTVELNDENYEKYRVFIGEDMAENLERIFYRGLLVLDDEQGEPLAGMIWELLNTEDAEHTQSHIRWFSAENEQEAALLFSVYKEKTAEENVECSHVTIPAKKHSLHKQFLQQEGFSLALMEGDEVLVHVSEILSMPILKKKRPSLYVHPLSELPFRSYRRVISTLDHLGMKGNCEDISYLPRNYFDSDLSCYYEEQDSIQGMLLFHKTPSGHLELALLRAMPKKSKEIPQILLQLMAYCAGRMESLYPGDAIVAVNRHDQSSLFLTEKLFPRGFGRPVYSGSRKEK